MYVHVPLPFVISYYRLLLMMILYGACPIQAFLCISCIIIMLLLISFDRMLLTIKTMTLCVCVPNIQPCTCIIIIVKFIAFFCAMIILWMLITMVFVNQ